MRGWRSKLIFLLIVYFAGFITAIYIIAPSPEKQANLAKNTNIPRIKFKSEDFAKSLNKGMHKCIDMGKDIAWQTGKFVKQKMDDK